MNEPKQRKICEVRLDRFEKPHIAGYPWLPIRIAWYLVNYCIFFTFVPVPSVLKRGLLRMFGAKVGRGVVIKPRVRIKSPWALTIGEYSWLGEDCWIDNHVRVHIGRHCCISQGVYICTGNHDYNDVRFHFFGSEVTICDGCWIGAKANVSPGAEIETMAVIGLGVTIKGRVQRNRIIVNQSSMHKAEKGVPTVRHQEVTGSGSDRSG
jgi:putative colanic acid biosynthesis acetyltransferase WcaF